MPVRPEARRKPPFNWRVFVGAALFWTLLVDLVSGVFVFSPGHGGSLIGIRPLGLGFSAWAAWHTIIGFLLIAVATYHVIFNWRPLVNYFRQKAGGLLRPEFGLSLLLAVYLALATAFAWPPAPQIWGLRTPLNAAWYAHRLGGETVAELAKLLHASPEKVLARWARYGVKAAPGDRLAEVSRKSSYPVYDLYQIARGRKPVLRAKGRR